jgi:hypothetical protein
MRFTDFGGGVAAGAASSDADGGPMASESPFRVRLTREQRVALEERARAYTLPYRDVLRAKIVLLAAEGLQDKDIAARLNTAAKASRFSLPTARGPTLTICICPRIRFPSQK